MKLLAVLLLTVALGLVSVIGFRYYVYVTNTQSPYDEVGIELNQAMPGPIRDWGCGKLKDTFGKKALPPLGCQSTDAKTWR